MTPTFEGGNVKEMGVQSLLDPLPSSSLSTPTLETAAHHWLWITHLSCVFPDSDSIPQCQTMSAGRDADIRERAQWIIFSASDGIWCMLNVSLQFLKCLLISEPRTQKAPRKNLPLQGKKQIMRSRLTNAQRLLNPRWDSDSNSPVIETLGPTGHKERHQRALQSKGAKSTSPQPHLDTSWAKGENLPKLIKRETWKCHLLLQSFSFLFPVDPGILSVLPSTQD